MSREVNCQSRPRRACQPKALAFPLLSSLHSRIPSRIAAFESSHDLPSPSPSSPSPRSGIVFSLRRHLMTPTNLPSLLPTPPTLPEAAVDLLPPPSPPAYTLQPSWCLSLHRPSILCHLQSLAYPTSPSQLSLNSATSPAMPSTSLRSPPTRSVLMTPFASFLPIWDLGSLPVDPSRCRGTAARPPAVAPFLRNVNEAAVRDKNSFANSSGLPLAPAATLFPPLFLLPRALELQPSPDTRSIPIP